MSYGGSLQSNTLQGLLNASYNKKIKKVDNFQQDRGLSTKTSKVYVDPNTNQVVVAHKGTSGVLDWGNNAVYALGGTQAYKHTGRFKEAQKVQQEAEQKYGNQNITTIGHSQGGLQAELLGKKGKETITLNKATRPFANIPAINQFDIHTTGDVVSSLNPFQNYNKQHIIHSNLDPLSAHSIDTLENVNTIYGQGLMVGGNNELTNYQIDNELKDYKNYKGCFIKNELPKQLTNGFYVINLNGHSHWTVLYKDNDDIFYYDSFGFEPPEEVETKLGNYYWNDTDIQDIDTSSCGYYVIAFIKFMNNKINPLKSYKTFVSLFNSDTKKNEKILETLIDHL